MKQIKNEQKTIDMESYPIETQLPNYNIFQLIFITIRLLPATAIMCFVILFQDFIRPNIMIPSVRRYLSCIVNLISIRIVLLLLGFFKFQCQNYRYFDKSSRMLTFRSGWVGVASHKNLIDFLYYSYLFNPVYARMVQYHDGKETANPVKLFYTPLSFKEAFFASMNYRGFDPIIIKEEKELKRFKKRKMLMPTLISQCFQQVNGPILIFLPSLRPKQQINLHRILGEDMFDNQKKFLRSGLVFASQIQQMHTNKSTFPPTKERITAQFSTKIYINQLTFLTKVCSQLKVNILSTTAIQIQKYKYQYNREVYAAFVDEQFTKNGYKIESMSFTEYIDTFDRIEQQIRRKQQSLNSNQNEEKQIENRKEDQPNNNKQFNNIKPKKQV